MKLGVCVSHFSHVPLFAYEILNARILEWVTISSSRGFSRPRD